MVSTSLVGHRPRYAAKSAPPNVEQGGSLQPTHVLPFPDQPNPVGDPVGSPLPIQLHAPEHGFAVVLSVPVVPDSVVVEPVVEPLVVDDSVVVLPVVVLPVVELVGVVVLPVVELVTVVVVLPVVVLVSVVLLVDVVGGPDPQSGALGTQAAVIDSGQLSGSIYGMLCEASHAIGCRLSVPPGHASPPWNTQTRSNVVGVVSSGSCPTSL